jgi:hypothetical protein
MELQDNSLAVLEDAETQVLDDTPEAYVRREIGLEKERHHIERKPNLYDQTRTQGAR